MAQDWFAIYDLTTRELISTAPAGAIAAASDLAARNFGKIAIAWEPTPAEVWDSPTLTFKPRAVVADFITPIVTRAQASAIIKTLFETNPNAWTVTQERQAIYGILYLLFRDFKTGVV